MKFNTINKFVMMLSLIAVLVPDIDASRPGAPGVSGVAGSSTAGSSTGYQGGRYGRHHGRKHRRSGTICRQRTGCKKVTVTGKVSSNGNNAVVCKGNVCRKATVRRPRGGGGFGGGGIWRGKHHRRGGRGRRPIAPETGAEETSGVEELPEPE